MMTCQSFLSGWPCTRWVRAPGWTPLTQQYSVHLLALFALVFKIGHVVDSRVKISDFQIGHEVAAPEVKFLIL